MDFQLINEARFVLVVEKDASFQKLTDEGFFEIYPNSILVTVILVDFDSYFRIFI